MLFPTEYILLLNIAVLLILVLFAYSGYQQGFFLKLLGCFGFLVCALVAWMLSYPLSTVLHLYPQDHLMAMRDPQITAIFYQTINRVVVFVLLFFLLSLTILFMKPILKAVGKLPLIQEMNKLLGTALGALQGLVFVMVVSFIFSTPLFANGLWVINESCLKPINAMTEGLLFFSRDQLGELKAIQKVVTPSTMPNEEDINYIAHWLSGYDLSQEQIDTFLQELKGE